MSVTVTYKCDKCNTPQNDTNQFWVLSVVLTSYGTSISLSSPKQQMHACRSCVIELGLLPPAEKPAPGAPPPPTLEDLIREIAQEVVIEASQYR